MKNCPYCGGEIKDEASVCKYCGKGLVFMSQNGSANQVRIEQPVVTPPIKVENVPVASISIVDKGATPTEGPVVEHLIPDPSPFVSAPGEHKMKRCPYCAEEIRAEASICRFCGRNLGSTPVVSETPVVNDRFESTIRDYQRNGYSLVSRMANSAIMERRAPIAGGLLAMWIVTFWIGAIIYGSEGNRKKYTVTINATADDRVDMIGGTIAEMEKDKKTRNIVGWIIFGVVIASFICVLASGAYNQ